MTLGARVFGRFERGSADEVVPRAALAHLDDISDVNTGTPAKSGEFASQRDAPSVAGKPGSKDVGDVHQTSGITDRARGGHLSSDLTCCANKLGMRIADVRSVEYSVAIVREHRRAGQPVVDMAL